MRVLATTNKKMLLQCKMAAPIAVPGMSRKEEANPFNYTEDQKAIKKLALKQMAELWPTVNPTWAEWVYDLCKNTDEDELQKIMVKCDTNPPKHFTVNDPRSHLYEEAQRQSAETRRKKLYT